MNKWQKTLFGGFSFRFHAEVNKIKNVNGNHYMELVEFDKDHSLVAKIKWIIFDKQVIDSFEKKTNVLIDQREGSTMLMQWNLNFHKDYWASIIIKQISSEFSSWKLVQQKKQILTQLEKLGIKNNNLLLNHGFPPYHIALITSEKSQWANDFTSILEQSWIKYKITPYYGAIHWNQAKENVLRQLQSIHGNQTKFSHVAIVRGGGESSWMVRQNDPEIAKAICSLDTPMILAVWHTDDTTVLDHIVHTPAKTPSDAAYVLVNETNTYLLDTNDLYKNINTNISSVIQVMKVSLDSLIQSIKQQNKLKIKHLSQKIENLFALIAQQSPDKLKEKGYWIVKHKWSYITKDTIKKLQKGEELTIDIYDHTLTVTIKDKK